MKSLLSFRLNFQWWVNRKDAEGRPVFSAWFLEISVSHAWVEEYFSRRIPGLQPYSFSKSVSLISLHFWIPLIVALAILAVHGFVVAGFRFKGLDNIGVVDRSQPFPNGAPGQWQGSLKNSEKLIVTWICLWLTDIMCKIDATFVGRWNDKSVRWYQLDGILQFGSWASFDCEASKNTFFDLPGHGLKSQGLTLMRMALELALNNSVCAKHFNFPCFKIY